MELYKIVLSFVLAGLCLVVGFTVFVRNRKVLLNRIFLLVFLAYTVFFTFDGFIGLLYADLALANMSRDISSLAVLTGHACVFLTSIYIWKGKVTLANRRFLLPFVIITAALGIIGQLDDWVEVDLALQSYTIQHGIIGLICAYYFGATLIFLSIVIYLKIWAGTQDLGTKARLRHIVTGLLVVVAGQVMQAVLMPLLSEAVYYALVFPEALVYSLWAVGVLIASRGLW